MKTRIAYWKEWFTSKFWATPTLVSVGIVALLPLLRFLSPSEESLIAADTVQSARAVLSSIATAVMTVIGVLLSITIVVLAQVSTQYTPRIIENFIRSTASQVVFGVYVGTFAYSLLLLRVISDKEEAASPQLALVAAILLAIVCLALLVYFVHHLAKSIKSITILAGIARQAIETIEDLAADLRDQDRGNEPFDENLPATLTLEAPKDGYLQQIEWRRLAGVLAGMRWSGRLCVVPGDYVHQGSPLIQLQAAEPPDDARKARVVGLFEIGLERTHSQDARFGLRQLVDVALRALSPSINDPSTAVEALNEISTVLLHYTRVGAASTPVRLAHGGCLLVKQPEYHELVDLAVNEIAVAAKTSRRIQARLEAMLEHCMRVASDSGRRNVLARKRDRLRRFFAETPGEALFE